MNPRKKIETMITKEITLCGKQVTIGYCFATELGFKTNADEDIEDFIIEVIEMFQKQSQMPDLNKCIYLIYAAMLAYYESVKQEVPISAEDMMYNMQPLELGAALATILNMRANFYKAPKGEPDDKPKSEEEKKADEKNA